MCDTFAVVPPVSSGGAVWFGKNSDREPGEAQALEHHGARRHRPGQRVRCTFVEIPQAERTHEVLLSRPVWMWGAEMGVNEHGLAIGNQAVFTRLEVAATGLTGMDLVRLALERTTEAAEALELIVALLARHGQGGHGGFRNRRMRYHNAFLLADPTEAWVLETAGPHWAARRVRGIHTISNHLSIDQDFDRLSPGALRFARRQKWCRGADDFGFARCFEAPSMRVLSGGPRRASCTFATLYDLGEPTPAGVREVLCDHGGAHPVRGWRMQMPCAHASWWPTRHSGQTTASLMSRLHPTGSTHWATGTSAPCLSVFKPVVLGDVPFDFGPRPDVHFDDRSLFWRHERLHRLVLADYDSRRAVFETERAELQWRAFEPAARQPDAAQGIWHEHHRALEVWTARVQEDGRAARWTAGQVARRAWWAQQSRRDRIS